MSNKITDFKNVKPRCEELIKSGKYNEAIREIKKNLKDYADDQYIHWLLGLATENSGDAKTSANIYKEIVQKDPTYIKAHFSYKYLLERLGKKKELHKIYYEQKHNNKTALNLFLYGNILEDAQEKLDIYHRALSIEPGFIWAHIGMGYTFTELKQYNKALDVFSKIVLTDAHGFASATINRYLGELHYKTNKMDDALTYCQSAIKIDPLNSMSYFRTGYILSENKKQIKEGLNYYRIALKINPFRRLFLLSTGYLLVLMDEYEKGLEFLRKALQAYEKKDKYRGVVLLNIGWALSKQGKTEEAIAYPKKVLEFDKTNKKAFQDLGLYYFELGNCEESKKYFEKNLELEKDNKQRGWILNEVGRTFFKEEHYKEAIEKFKESVQHDPDFSWSHSNMGLAYKNLGNYKSAITCHNKVLELNNDASACKKALENLGSCYFELGNCEESRKYFEKNLELEKDNKQRGWIFNEVGRTFLKEEHYEEAIEKFKESVQYYPNYSWSYYNMGLAYSDLGNWKFAEDCYNKVLELNNDVRACKESRIWLIKVYFFSGEYHKGLNKAEQMLKEEINTENKKDLLESISYCYFFLSDYRNSIETCEKLKKIDCRNTTAHFLIGLINYHYGKYVEAKSVLIELLKFNPDRGILIATHMALRQIALREGKQIEAQQIFEKIKNIDPNSPLVLQEKALYCFEKGNLKKAEAYLQDIIKNQLSNLHIQLKWNAYFTLGVIHQKRKQYDLAIKEFENALQCGFSNGITHHALAHLYEEVSNKRKVIYHVNQGITSLREKPNLFLFMLELEVLKMRITYGKRYSEESIKQAQEFFDKFQQKYGKETNIRRSIIEIVQQFYICAPIFNQTINIRERLLQRHDEFEPILDIPYFINRTSNVLVEFFGHYCECVRAVISFRQRLREASEEGIHKDREINDLLNNIDTGLNPLFKRTKTLLKEDKEGIADASTYYIDTKLFSSVLSEDAEKIMMLYNDVISTYAQLKRKYKLLYAKYGKAYVQQVYLVQMGDSYYFPKSGEWISLDKIMEKYKSILKEMGNKKEFFDLKKNCLFRIAEIYSYKKRLPDTKYYLTQAVALIEKQRQDMSNYNQVRAAMFATNIEVYAELIKTNYLLKNYEGMLSLINASQNRELLDVLIGKNVSLIPDKRGEYGSSEKDERLEKISTFNAIREKLEKTLKQPKKFMKYLSSRPEIKDRKVAVLQYFRHADKLFAYFIGLDDLQPKVLFTQTYELSILIEELIDDVYAVYRQDGMEDTLKKEDFVKRSQISRDLLVRVSKILLPEALLDAMRDYEIVIVIPFKQLHHIPFNCLLQPNNKHLFEEWIILQNPSLATLAKEISKKSATKNPSISAFFGIRTKSAPEEYMRIKEIDANANMYPDLSSETADFKNNKEQFLRYHDKSKFLLLYSHFFVSNRNLLDSAFYIGGEYVGKEAIAEDELKLSEIITNCNFTNTEFLIMCGCDSGLAGIEFNEFIGASVAFMSKGLPSILASMWPVNPQINKYFTESFYFHFFKEKRPKYEAFVYAQRDLYKKIKKRPKFNHLLYLGPWVLMGNVF